MDITVKNQLTPIDVIRSGACSEGVKEWLDEFAPNITAMPVKAALRLCESEDQKSYIARAANLDGYGYGNGYGNGDGYGYGEF